MKPRNRLPPRPGAKLQPRQVPLAIGWYSEAEWRQVKAAATDAERFEQTFQAWETMAERALNDLRAQGLWPTRFNIIANDLLAWCASRAGATAGASAMKPPRLACVIYKRPARTALAFAWHQGLLRSDQRRWAAAPLALAATHEEAPGIDGVDQLAGERRCFAR
jgi:hypothetical protein